MKMTFDKFNGLLQTMEELGRKQHAAYKLGIELSDFTDDFYGVINDLLRAVYGDDGYEWISWFMFENDFGRKGLGATMHGKPTCYDALSLWKEIEAALDAKSDL